MNYPEYRCIEGDTIYSPSLPRQRVQISSSLIYLGDLQYILQQTYNVQEFFFVDVNGIGHITRLLLVHYQGFMEGKEGAFVHPSRQVETIDGHDFVYDVLFTDLNEYIHQHPDSAMARAADYIRQRSYTLTGQIVIQRFLRLVDEARRNQFAIIYMEDSETHNLSADMLHDQPETAQALQERARSCFSILD